jgi:membrane associated rhomboid family serine protease
MFLPIGDSPNPKGYTPFATWTIIALNICVFLLINLPLSSHPADISHPLLADYVKVLTNHGIPLSQIRQMIAQTSALDLCLYEYGYKPGAPSLMTLFSSLFLHSGFWHLFGNMLFLYIYGDNVEYQMGRIRFLFMYLFTGVIASLSFGLLSGGSSMTPLVGASGAISGVLGCYFLMFPLNKIKVFVFLFPFFVSVIRIPARIVLTIYVVLDNILPLLLKSGGNVAHGAHLGGFFAGLAIAALGESFAWRSPRFSSFFSRIFFQQNKKTPSGVANGFFSTKKTGVVEHNFDNLPIAQLSTISDDILFCSIADRIEKGDLIAADRMVKRSLRAKKEKSTQAELYFILGKIRFHQGLTTAAYQHLMTALDLTPAEETEKKIQQLLVKIELGK